MQYANLFPSLATWMRCCGRARRERSALEQALAAAPDPAARRAALNAFRIADVPHRHAAHRGHSRSFGRFAAELTGLAEVVVDGAYRLVEAELRALHGAPRLENGAPCGLSICALGKCGGRELGFASDIELMFIYAGSGETLGPARISCFEYYNKLVLELTRCIQARREAWRSTCARPHGWRELRRRWSFRRIRPAAPQL